MHGSDKVGLKTQNADKLNFVSMFGYIIRIYDSVKLQCIYEYRFSCTVITARSNE